MDSKSNYKYIIAISGFILMATTFSIVNSVSTILVAPVINARNFTISEYSLLFTINAVTMAIFSPLVGSLLNKVNIKIIMTISSILAGVGYIMYGFANNIFAFYAIGIVVSIGVCGLTTIPISTMISDWFDSNKKASVMGIVFAGIGTGTFFWMQLVSKILEKTSYKWVYLLLGSVILIISIPISLFIAKRPSYAHKNTLEDNNSIQNKSINFKEISKTPGFWSFTIGLFLMGISFAGIKQHVQSYLSTLGYSLSFNANIGSLIAVVGLSGNIVGGIVFDKFKTKYVLGSLGIISITSIILLFLASQPFFAYLFTIFYGMTMFVSSVWPAFGVSRVFPNENYSVIFGVANMFITIGASIGPFLSGIIADTYYGYPAAWTIYLILTVIYYFLFIKTVK